LVTLATPAAGFRASVGRERAAFWASVGVVLTFSQCWVMLLTGPPVEGAVADPSASALVRNFYFPAYLIILILAATQLREAAAAALRAWTLSLLVALTFISMTWSIDPDVTERRGVAILFTTLAGLVIAARFTWPRFLEVFAAAFAVVVVLCFAFALLLPSYGKMTFEFPGAWRGVWDQKNTLGYNMSVGFMVFAAAALANPARRWLWIGFGAAAIVLLVLSSSKTSVVSVLIGCGGIGLVALARRGPVSAIGATFIGVSALIGLAFTVYIDPDLLLGLLGKDATLTGRTKIWTAVLHQIEKRPWTGYGYGAVWDDTSRWGPFYWISKEQGFVIHEAHNSWLGIWLELGYIGLAAWGLLFAAAWSRTVLAIYQGPWAYFALPFLAVFSLHTLTEMVALVQNDWIWLMFSAIAVKLALPPAPATGSAQAEPPLAKQTHT
jgi:O-antigen ligase